MTAAPVYDISVNRVVPSTPEAAYAVVADVASIGTRSPETLSAAWLGEERGVGARFRGRNRAGWVRWSTVATVTDDQPGRIFAFKTDAPSSTTWTYTFAPVDGGTEVTESMRKEKHQILPIRVLQRLAGIADRHEHLRAGMAATLERLAVEVAVTAPR